MAWEPVFESLAPGEVADRTVAVDYSGQGRRSRGKATFPARLIVLRLPPEAAERATAAVRRKHRRHYARHQLRHQLLPLTIQSAGYPMLLTSLPPTVPASEVLAAYRPRWQVELAFKRLKSLLGLDRLPAKGEALARSWLLAHLILALLIEDAAQDLLAVPPSAARDDLRTPPSRPALARRAGAARCMPDRRSRPTGRRRAARRTRPALQAPPRAAASANMPAHAGKRPRGCLSWRL